MKLNLVASWAVRVAVLGAFLAAVPVMATDRAAVTKTSEPVEDYDQIELFQAISEGKVEVQLIPKDATRATVVVTNKTDRPVSIRMPEAFAGVPVLAQGLGGMGGGLGGMGGGMGGMGGGMGGMGGNQGFGGGMGGGMGGGGFGGMGGGMGGMGGMGGGFMNLAPEKVGRVRINTFCLEHGKRDPNPQIKYEIRPIAEFTDKPEIAEICKMLATDQLPQNSAQAVAWHVMDGLTWEQLAAKDRVRLSNGFVQKWFSFDELMLAQRALMVAMERAEGSDTPSPGDAYNR